MANGKDAFEERLKRLGASNPAPAAAQQPVQAAAPLPVERTVRMNLPQQKTGGNSTIFAFIAVVMLLLGGGAFATMAFAPDLIFSTEVLN